MTQRIIIADVLDGLRQLGDGSVHCCVTSPPYWGLRDYGTAKWEGGDAACDHAQKRNTGSSTLRNDGREAIGTQPHEKTAATVIPYRGACGKCGATRVDRQIGLEKSPDAYVSAMVEVFREVRRCLRDDGTLWLNLGSSYASGGTSPNQSRSGVLSCGTDDKEPRGSLVAGRACPCCGGELQDGSLIRRDYIARTSRPTEPTPPPDETTSRGSGHSASIGESASSGGARRSTKPASLRRGLDVCGHEATASACPEGWQTSACSSPPCDGNSACTSGTAKIDHPSLRRTSGTGFFCTACGYCTTTYPLFKPKDLVNIPFMVAEALRADGWWLRSVIVWAKKAPMPESVTDRPTSSWEPIFLLAKSERYWYDAEAVSESSASGAGTRAGYAGYSARAEAMGRTASGNEKDGVVVLNAATRNLRNVWHLSPEPFRDAHFATFPTEIPRRCIKAGCPIGGTVLDPFLGSGTTLAVAAELERNGVGIELNPEYAEIARDRIGRAEKPQTYQSQRATDSPLFEAHTPKQGIDNPSPAAHTPKRV